MPREYFRCGSEDHLIATFPKQPKENEKCKKQVRFNKKDIHTCNNRKNSSDQNIYVSMACVSDNDELPSRNFDDSLQLTFWILDSGATCHMTPEVSDFIPCLLEETDKHIAVADEHHITEKQGGQVQIKFCDDHVDPFIAMLHNVILSPELCDSLFLTIMLMNLGHTCLFH